MRIVSINLPIGIPAKYGLKKQLNRVISASTTLTEATMRYNSNPAAATAIELSGLMSIISTGAMNAFDALQQVGRERYQASIYQGYANALQEAQTYAWEVNAIAEVAIQRVHELEVEVADLRAACQQRQGLIDRMRAA
jgi:hypothetical protein